ncbi:MAG: hypothetical protein AAGF79_11730 [Pseudomonadota bacterium]
MASLSKLLRGTVLAALVATPLASQAQPKLPPLPLTFLPPEMAPQDLCNQPDLGLGEIDPSIEGGQEELTDRDRIRFLTADIRSYQRRDADLYFDFIDALITKKAGIDAEFAGAQAAFARIDLHVAANRFDALAHHGLIADLAGNTDLLGYGDRVRLAQYYRMGLGVPQDRAQAQEFIRQAAFQGNARALLEIAHLQRQGQLVEGWTAPLDLTVTMAFGGMLGELTPGVCAHAERIAKEYLKGELVAFNPEVALAWRRFAADLGGAEAAWRVVEFHLDAAPDRQDNVEMRHYLRRAVGLGRRFTDGESDRLIASGKIAPQDVIAILGDNIRATGGRSSLVPFLELGINIDGRTADEDGLYVQYLREIAALPPAPGDVFTRLANEVSIRQGRWAAEPEIIALLEEATRRDDPIGMQRLAQRLVRYRDDPKLLALGEALLVETVDLHGLASSMDRLDALYRCQRNDAPRLQEARHWRAAFHATSHGSLQMSATDLIALDRYKDPEDLARIQSQALSGRPTALADQAQRLQSQEQPSVTALRYWADRLDNSDQALEAFAELQFELATNPVERAQAVEVFRRVYLNNGVTTALDLAIALVEDDGRDPEIAAEIVDLLTRAGNRGEGAAIRLLARLHSDRPEVEIYAQFAQVIEARGDFLALMFAIPHIPQARLDDYMDRAVSLMTCGTKDIDELGDAYAIRQMPEMSYHWRQIGLTMEHGHVLSKLRLSDPQMEAYDSGVAPGPVQVVARAQAEGAPFAHRRLFLLAVDADRVSYDPRQAASELVAGVGAGDLGWALSAYRMAGPEVREILSETLDVVALLQTGADSGDRQSAYDLGMILRDTASVPDDLARSARWLRVAADAGHDDAMFELGFALGFGLGIGQDVPSALDWLDRAATSNHPRAEDLAHMLRVANN